MQRRVHGFTLTETAVATAILAIASAALASLFVSSGRTHVRNRDHAAAAILLADKMEELKATRDPLSGADSVLPFQRSWQVEAGSVKTLTVIIHDGTGKELMRASAAVSPTW